VVAFVLLLLQAISEVIKLIAILRGMDVEIEEPEMPIRVE
jgi:TRAP-type mannitol/chloroaromatic compound transport system permease small subunit